MGLILFWTVLKRALPAILVLGVLAWSWTNGQESGYSKANAEFTTYKAQAAQANAKAQIQISAKFQTTLEERARELQDLTAERDALLSRVRNRPSRASTAASSSPSEGSTTARITPVISCGPDQLYREDAEFLVRFAADAEEVRKELISSRQIYENARAALLSQP